MRQADEYLFFSMVFMRDIGVFIAIFKAVF
jgi:hypothetical protein